MKKIYIFILSVFILACSDDNSPSEPILTKERVVGTWKLISKNRVNTSQNIATTCDLEKGRIIFSESFHCTRITGVTDSQLGNCYSNSFENAYYILPNVIRLESGNTKNIYAAKIVSGELYMTKTSSSISSGSTPVPVEDQVTEVYIRQ